MKNPRKVAFVHYPYAPSRARLETMPFALNSVIALANCGCQVDVFLWEKPICDYSKILPANVDIHYGISFDTPDIYGRIINKINVRHQILRLQFDRYKDYDCVFGLGQIGSYIASVIANASKCPSIYLNDEFPSWFGDTIWSKLERQAVQESTIVVVPDLQRFAPLCMDLEISDRPHACLPNIPVLTEPLEQIDWHARLKIPAGYTPFLHAGSVADWAQVPELLSSLPYWEEKTVLVIHSRSTEGTAQYRQQLAHLDVPGRVIWSSEPISEHELNSLVSYCAGNFALYRNSGPNIEYIGFSSGKLMRSLACGSPVIASNLSSLRFVRDAQIGVLVNHPAEIPEAISKLLHNRESYLQRCLDFCNTHASFEKAWTDFCIQLKEISKLDLLDS
jgi:glycosyltransferase involved in cell wall biosynthesis